VLDNFVKKKNLNSRALPTVYGVRPSDRKKGQVTKMPFLVNVGDGVMHGSRQSRMSLTTKEMEWKEGDCRRYRYAQK